MARSLSHPLSRAAPLALTPSRGLLSRRPVSYAVWLLLGAAGTYVDKIHEAFGVVSYPNPTWVGERFVVSPVYVCAGLGFYLLHTMLVGHRGGGGVFGGAPLRTLEALRAFALWIAVYAMAGVLGRPGLANGWAPFALTALLAGLAAQSLWSWRRTAVPLFAAVVALIGTGFEWIATAGGHFAYPVCPSRACLGATVPLVWLPLLYVHAALLFHRLAGNGMSEVAVE